MNEELENLDISKISDTPKNKGGRPRQLIGKPKNLIVQLEDTLHDAFKVYCQVRGVKMSELIREVVVGLVTKAETPEASAVQDKLADWVEKYRHLPGASLQQVVEKFRELQKELEDEQGSNGNGK